MEFKVVLLGTSGCGKTCIYQRFADNVYDPGAATSTASFSKKIVTLDDTQVSLFLWDTAGQERFHSVSSVYFRGSHYGLVVFDVSSAASLQQSKTWLDKMRRSSDDVVLYLIGNKCDLAEREVTRAMGKEFAITESLTYREVSAKTGEGISELFDEIAAAAKERPPVEARVNIVDIQKREPVKKGCC